MPVKHALVVDDSRVASIALRRLLEGYGLTVDTVESAEDSLKFLKQHRPPAAIFMDHMMPGMDGFEALQAIKRDPALAAVPVVMYTSKEGDAYMGQAKSLGAAAVLRKPIKPLQLSKILEELGIAAPSDNRAIVPHTEKPAEDDMRHIAREAADAVAQGNLPALLRRLFDEQRAALQNDIAALQNLSITSPTQGRGRAKAVIALALGALLATTAWLWSANREAIRERDSLQKEMARLKAEASTPRTDADVDAATREELLRSARDRNVLAEALVWALNANGYYDYDQVPLSDERAHILRELLTRLTQANYKGVVRLEAHVAEFCLARTEQGTWRLPNDDAPATRCDIVNYTNEQAINLGKRQSLGFARLLATVPATYPGLRVETVSFGKDRVAVQYPPPHSLQTAGDWNKIARRNNRVEFVLNPAP